MLDIGFVSAIIIPMYIESVPNRSSPPAILLRECWREGGKTRKRTIANLTRWPEPVVDAMRRALKGERLVNIEDVFSIQHSLPHGNVEAILGMMRRLKLDTLISAKPCRERDLVMGMIAERLSRDPVAKAEPSPSAKRKKVVGFVSKDGRNESLPAGGPARCNGGNE